VERRLAPKTAATEVIVKRSEPHKMRNG